MNNPNIIYITIIGEGGFGKVYKAKHVLDGQIYAVKQIPLKNSYSVESLLKEVRTLARLDHPNILRYNNSWLSMERSNSITNAEIVETNKEIVEYNNEKDKDKMYLCVQMELMHMDLASYMMEKKFNKNERIEIFKNILYGLNYLHSQEIVHCDIKPENILISFDINNTLKSVKISDFGLSTTLKDEPHTALKYYGSEMYMHPKLLDSTHPTPTKNTDLYSLSILGFELSLDCQTKMEKYKKIEQFKKGEIITHTILDNLKNEKNNNTIYQIDYGNKKEHIFI